MMAPKTLISAQNDAREVYKHAGLNLTAGHTLIKRSYLAELDVYPVNPLDQRCSLFNSSADMRIFRIERIVQENKQSVLESTAAVYTALGAAGYSVFLFLQSDGKETELYIGTCGEPGRMLGKNSGDLLQATFRGHFPGSALHLLSGQATKHILNCLGDERNNPSASVTAVTGVPALSTENRDHFMQGMERFINAAEHHKYQALILAEPVSSKNLDSIRSGYEQVATQLSPLLKQQISYGEQDSDSVGLSISQSLSTSLGHSLSLTETRGTNHSIGSSMSENHGSSDSLSSQTMIAKAGASGAPLLGGFIGLSVGGGFGGTIGAQMGASVANLLSEQKTTGQSSSSTQGSNESYGESQSESTAHSRSQTETKGVTDSQSLNRITGSSCQISIEVVDKSIEQLLGKIDHHLQRIGEAKTYGAWNSAAYFIGDSRASSEALASIFLGLIRGSKSIYEDFAMTTWTSENKSRVLDWLSKLSHPQLTPNFAGSVPVSFVTPATLISSKEMAVQLGLPRDSTSTVSVVRPQAFGRKVQYVNSQVQSDIDNRKITLGNVRHLWEKLPQTIELSIDQLASHVFISGSTGSGKSNALYEILRQLDEFGVKFLVIEPAKGEYKHVFGSHANVTVLGTNPAHSALLRINPFKFPVGIHVLEHVDRLVEIFNVCWPMYAAMPAVLKEAVLQAYQECGWDLESSNNHHSDQLFPTFVDLLHTLQKVIETSAYSQELKGNYIGALSTRIKSLTNGLNGQLFGADEIDNRTLFDSNVIVDLSRIGSTETKALIMGTLVMRLSEYRMASGGMNQPLKHVTVLEEAHNLLKGSTRDGQAEGANLVGKSVEMLTNAIAEMRTYGEGFIIVDQSPNAVDVAAIRNTNTKIIMRLPDEMDRRLIGKSVSLREDQLDEISRLPKGVAIVYQNDWLEPVQCQISKFTGDEFEYHYQPAADIERGMQRKNFHRHLLNLLLSKRVNNPERVDCTVLLSGLYTLPIPSYARISFFQAIREYQDGVSLSLWRQESFGYMAQLIVEGLGCRQQVFKIVHKALDYAHLNELLDDLINQYVEGISIEMALATQQCLMKDYSMQCEDYIGVYSMWRAYHEKGIRP